MINYKTTKEFDKDFKALHKRFRTLDSDLKTFLRFSIETYYEQHVPSTSFVPIENACTEQFIVNKVRKFACKSLPGKGCQSGIRITFLWDSSSTTIYFIEIYFKGDKENEDRERIKTLIKQLN